MCGLAALFGKQLQKTAIAALRPMAQVIRHRGPDDEGYAIFTPKGQHCVVGGPDTPAAAYESSWAWAPRCQPPGDQEFIAALGHRRLAIIDLSPAGHQPMCTQDERYWISYNGEIYNYRELRQELQRAGHNFQTESDTEVILRAYQEWGRDCLSFFNGMFALVIYDKIDHTVFAGRDRFGVKPLYFWKSPQGFVAFASEIKQFTVLPGWEAKLQGQRTYDFLNWGALDHTHETLFAGVHQLRGGEYLFFKVEDLPRLNPQRWYQLTPRSFKGSFEDASKAFADLLQDAVRLRLRADVPVGSCLSGGLDSSSIVCLMHSLLKEQGGRQLTFSACSEVAQYDERNYIDLVVQKTGVEAHYTYPTVEELISSAEDIVWHQDEPFGSTSIFAQWLVFKLVKEQGVKVMLDGQGADEHLAGYHGFFGNSFYDHFVGLRWKRLLREMRLTRAQHSQVYPWSLLANKLLPDAIRQPIRRALGKSVKQPDWLNPAALGAECIDPFAADRHKSVRDQSIQQLLRSSVPRLLHYEDRDSMAHSIESRTPFLDYRLVEFSLGLPAEHKIGQGWTKKVLREGMRGILPEIVRSRMDKMAFVTAEEDWIKKGVPDHFRKEVKEALERSQGLLNPSAYGLAEGIINGDQPYSHTLWRMISFGQWLKRFSVKTS